MEVERNEVLRLLWSAIESQTSFVLITIRYVNYVPGLEVICHRSGAFHFLKKTYVISQLLFIKMNPTMGDLHGSKL